MYKRILVCLDGSTCAGYAGEIGVALARAGGGRLLACHVYGARMHGQRFTDMEPTLPERYQAENRLADLRLAHGSLIREGFEALSAGYVEQFLDGADRAGVSVEQVTAEGRNYVGILEIARRVGADLIALGAHGLGDLGDGLLGSTTARVLTGAPCDVLVARRGWTGRCLLAGIDGSEAALAAAHAAAELARALGAELHLAAAYDPHFHSTVFRAMAHSLPAARQEEMGLAEQEGLHDELINDGLGHLYQTFLDAAAKAVPGEVRTALLTGKAYRAVREHAEALSADLTVLGRFGHHREAISALGSQTDAAIRMGKGNVLVVGGAPARASAGDTEAAPPAPASAHTEGEMPWEDTARARLDRVPSFARPMARRAVENAVRERGGECVTEADFEQVARQFGMGGGGHA